MHVPLAKPNSEHSSALKLDFGYPNLLVWGVFVGLSNHRALFSEVHVPLRFMTLFTMRPLAFPPASLQFVPMTVAQSVSGPLLILAASFVCDILFINFTRRMLNRIASITRADKIVLLLMINFMVCAALVSPGFIHVGSVKPYSLFWAETQLKLLGQFNFLDAAVCALFVLILLGVLLHNILWPSIERPLYSLHRFGVIQNKKLLWFVVTALVAGPAKDVSLAKWAFELVFGQS
jgi:hypothetical protein